MPRDVARAGLYRGSINLWVEDALTREYLSTLWNDPSVFFLVGGGNEGVRAIVKDADEAGFANVFGLTDRDFRPTNKPGWNDSSKTFRTLVLPVHEIENYLLDSLSLHSSLFNNRGLSETDIQTIIEEGASRLCWWAACREVVAESKRRFREPFVIDPPCTLNSQSAAKDHICNSPWFQKLDTESARTKESDIDQLLNDRYQEAQNRLKDGTWRIEFAGKEIFRETGSRIFDRTMNRGYNPTPADFDIDLAKDIAVSQVASGSRPTDLVDLLAALKSRIARTPSAP
jgi:hypothetical protein